MDNITENNKLIAEFMGIYFKDNEYQIDNENLRWMAIIANCLMDDTEEQIFYFHDDWSWLMEVVEKIEELDYCQIDISLNWCRIGYKGTLFNYDSRDYFKGITKLEAVYNACIEFIKWYNEQNKKNESL